ncbi:hypothetical protein Tco_1084118 [Tanacetum coccineum]
METLNESFPQGTDSGSGPRCQDTILGGAEAQTGFEAASKQSNDLPLLRVNTLGSREDSMKLMELMEHCTKLSELYNMVAYLQKSEGSEGFHQIIDFLTTSHISTLENRDMEITTIIDGKVKVVSEAPI